MKKFSVIALVVAAAMFCAIPAMAVTMDFSGYYRARGFWATNPSLDDQEPRTDAFMDMRLKMAPVLKIHDRLKITNEVLMVDDNEWGATDDYVSWQRAYLTANFDMFDLHVGRMAGGICGLTYCDSESDADRIKVGLKGMDPFSITLVYQKAEENDARYDQAAIEPSTADSDNDIYIGLFGFKPEGIDSGILIAYYDYASHTDDAVDCYNQEIWNLNPWFRGTFGPITAMAELEWKFGNQYDYSDAGMDDVDRDSKRWILDASFDFGQGNAGLGWAHADGQDADDDDYTNAGLGGADWEPLLILTNSTAGVWLGGVGNLNPDNNAVGGVNLSDAGFDIFYGYGSFAAMENVTLNAIFGWVKADETNTFGSNVDDDLGWEFDVGAKVQLMDNLTYDATVGYYSAGDFWKGGSSDDNVDDCWAVMHTIQVTF
jgi:hypothetical protein